MDREVLEKPRPVLAIKLLMQCKIRALHSALGRRISRIVSSP